ncbi:sugar phosphate isomerase/epimerase [Amaricoccus macauensis]|uniref:Sugar phosphate isomerase/epimerase n=1 Tax=Amaricoccus macauensis TaxID=57001 RepID=A0A840SVB4_9RHOB|nr:sugar phosphate isomerase/epimerase [Amaricoccus macauensis]MBB5223756.1 sugar phosphate isomerase/epimerase [Amaricoccus macauensis]
MSHRYSLAFLTVFELPPVEAVKAAKSAGYDLIGLRMLPAAPGAEADYPLLTDDRVLADTLAALDDTGIGVADIEIVRLKPETDVGSFERFFERGQRLGAKNVLVAGDDPEEARLAESFGKLARLAASFGLTVDLEFMPWTRVPDLATALRIVEASGEPNGGVLVDALHFDRSSSTLDEVAAMPRQRINYVQFCDGPKDYDRSDAGLIDVARRARLMPGDGGIDLAGFARAIPSDTVISIELPNYELAERMNGADRAALALQRTKAVVDAALAG